MKPRAVRKVKKEIAEFRKELKTLIVSAFGFVAALAWNDAITSIISSYVPSGSGWVFMVLKATIVTFLAVFVTLYLSRKNEEGKENKT